MAARDDVAAAARAPLAYRLTGRQWLAVDVVTAAVLLSLVLFNVELLHGFRYHAPDATMAALAAAGTLPVAVRRIWPIPVLAVVAAACCVLTALGKVPNAVEVTLGMAVYAAAVRYRRTVAVVLLVAVEAALGVAVLSAVSGAWTRQDVARGLLVAGALWFVGDSVRERRRYLAGLGEQAEQRRRAEAELGCQAVREERVRIARELHDVVAHSLSVVAVQAGVGRKIGETRPGEALQALRAVEVTGRSALEELRRILGLLRDDDGEQPSLAPVPGIEDLEELADSVRAAGIPVRLAVAGDPEGVPTAAALTAYRIVQEALTNVVKHARRAEASVRVRAGPDGVRITVTDTGAAGHEPAAGLAHHAGGSSGQHSSGQHGVGQHSSGQHGVGQHGIVGMRERAAAFGGTLDAAALPGGGFRVTAFLPVSGPTVGQVA